MATPTEIPDFSFAALNTIKLGEAELGPDNITIVVKLAGAKLKVDEQKASGKDKSKIKISGVENAEGTIEIEWTRHDDELVFGFLMDIDHNGPNKGKPRQVAHPMFALRRVTEIIITEPGEVEVKGDYRKTSLKFKEYTAPPPDAAGATKKPTDPMKWTAKSNATPNFGGAPGNTVTSKTGFQPGAGSAPKATPK